MIFTRVELDWLFHALRNVQPRENVESVSRMELLAIVEMALRKVQAEYAIPFTPTHLLMTFAAVWEGRCRTGDEQLMRHRLLDRIKE